MEHKMANSFTAEEGADTLAWLVGQALDDCHFSAAGGSALEAAYARAEEAGHLRQYDCHGGRDWYHLSDTAKATLAQRLGTTAAGTPSFPLRAMAPEAIEALANAARAREGALVAAYPGYAIEAFRDGTRRVVFDTESEALLARAAQKAFLVLRFANGDVQALGREAYEAVTAAIKRLTHAEIGLVSGKRDAVG